MVYESTRVWIETLALTIETRVLADLALALAKRYDEKGETSTAGELRKTLNELRSALAKVEEFNPLEDLLKR
jgi:hypothetical protein